MPQNPLGLSSQVVGNNAYVPTILDGPTALSTQTGEPIAGISGTSNKYNITAATVVKATPGRLIRVSVVVAGSAAGTANDCITTGAAAVGNQICSIPATAADVIILEWPCTTGIVIVPGTGQTLAVSFS